MVRTQTMSNPSPLAKKPWHVRLQKTLRRYWPVYALFIPCLVCLIIFSYAPMYGVVLAFKDFKSRLGILGSPWADPLFKHFEALFGDPYFLKVMRNTVVISVLRLAVGFPAPLILALMLNELRGQRFKRTVQTIFYLPNFISWVILGSMFKSVLGVDGLLDTFLSKFGMSAPPFFSDDFWFIIMLLFTEVWKSMGFSSIIYMAAIAGVDQTQYEAATLDGATRFQKMRYITIPGISGAVSIQLIMSLSGILSAGFDQIFQMYSPVVYDWADIIDTYVYRIGIGGGNYEVATALGIFKSVVGLVLIYLTNKIINKMGGEGIW